MFYFVLFLKSDTIYYLSVSQHEFISLLNDLEIEFKIEKHIDKDFSFNKCTYYYFDKKGKKHEIGYAASIREDRFITRIP